MKPAHLKIAFFFAFVVLISYFVLIITGDKGLRDLNAMKQELSDIKAENEKIQQKNIEMHRKIKRLKEDPEFVENIARQELKMIGKDEIVFKFKEDSTDARKQTTGGGTPTPESPPDQALDEPHKHDTPQESGPVP